jgi:hypothetical protein
LTIPQPNKTCVSSQNFTLKADIKKGLFVKWAANLLVWAAKLFFWAATFLFF